MSDGRRVGDAAFDGLAARLVDGGVSGVERAAPLGALTTYRVGGSASLSVLATSEDELRAVRDAIAACDDLDGLCVLVVGKGSNLLVADAGFHGLALHLGGALADVDLGAAAGRPDEPGHGVPDDGAPLVVLAGGGLGLPVLARRSVEAGLRGLEWAVGIPGSVGGALKMNAGGHGSDTASCLLRYRWIDVLGPGGAEADVSQLALGYRTSALLDSQVVVCAEFRVRRGDREAARQELSEIVRWRREHQPGGSNAGSVFVNPPEDSAGRLVEASGLRGLRMGTARVSEKHANFIQADAGGSADDVLDLMLHVQREVAAHCDVHMRAEVKLVGFEQSRTEALATSHGEDVSGEVAR